MAFQVTEPQYVWQLANGQWFATATQTRYATRSEAVNATRAWREARTAWLTEAWAS